MAAGWNPRTSCKAAPLALAPGATAQAMADGHRELARQLFAGLPAKAFDGFAAGLDHVIDRLRAVLSEPPYVGPAV
jgi:hypothetical protein